MHITIKDDFDLKKISESGEAFRIKEFPGGMFRFVTGNNILYIKNNGNEEYEVMPYVCRVRRHPGLSDFTCNFNLSNPVDALSNQTGKPSLYSSEAAGSPGVAASTPISPNIAFLDNSAWEKVWSPYFDLSRNYHEIRESVPTHDTFMRAAVKSASGIRILRQEPFETLISFIISQRKSIPAIKKSIELICRAFGSFVTTPYEAVYLFPDICDFNAFVSGIQFKEILISCKLGYRTEYVADAIKRVSENKLNLGMLSALNDENLLAALKSVKGVGNKVAACVSLFAYGRTTLAPVDTWISKIICQKYNGLSPFPAYKENAGIMQQYAFYYALKNKGEF